MALVTLRISLFNKAVSRSNTMRHALLFIIPAVLQIAFLKFFS